VIPVRPKRGILFRTGKELRDRVNRAGQTAHEGEKPMPVPAKSETGTA
jgi:integration host factor subunit beta